MLTATEDLLDSWPGTLIVVSHDRYLLERVTDQQYAILDHRLRHLPGGVDEYLKLRAREEAAGDAAGRDATGQTVGAAGTPAQTPALSGAELRAAQKELASIERKLTKLQEQTRAERAALADEDQSDYVGLAAKMEHITALEAEAEELEGRWFELTEQVG
jgi:flagellar motility protein MotE (MotC chaperone)